MNKFNAKQIKIASQYLQEKLALVQKKKNNSNETLLKINKKEESSLKKFVSSLFN